jgi:ribonuclease HI
VDAHPCGDGRWGLGLVLRTERGKCVRAMTKVVLGSDSIVDGEAFGLNEALNMVEAGTNTQIIIEMDAKTIVNAVTKRNFPHCYWGRIARRCRRMIDANPKISLRWVRRSGNEAAHRLANWAPSEPNKIWTDIAPICILDVIQKDMSLCNFDILIIFFVCQKEKNLLLSIINTVLYNN